MSGQILNNNPGETTQSIVAMRLWELKLTLRRQERIEGIPDGNGFGATDK